VKRVWIVMVIIAAPLGIDASALAQTFGSPAHFTEQGGVAVYGSVCAACHMPDDRGAEGAGGYPSLAHNIRLQEPGYPIAIILRGQRDMPSFARTLSDQQVADVVAYVQTHFGNAYPQAPTLADVKTARLPS
jgi:mono/diheme cytochrome c family protein